VSNSNTGFIRRLFDGYDFEPINNRREINLNARNRGITELLITNYAPQTTPETEGFFGVDGTT
jgi:hypothetical protein